MVMIEVITKCGVSVVQLRRGGLWQQIGATRDLLVPGCYRGVFRVIVVTPGLDCSGGPPGGVVSSTHRNQPCDPHPQGRQGGQLWQLCHEGVGQQVSALRDRTCMMSLQYLIVSTPVSTSGQDITTCTVTSGAQLLHYSTCFLITECTNRKI